jgi:hypothetical protein
MVDKNHRRVFIKPASQQKLKGIQKTKRGQIKIQQMSFMLIAVTLLFILVGVFFLSIRLSSLKKTASALGEENAMLLVSKLANSPEFSCGNAFGTSSRTSCVDFDKLMALKARVNDYSEFWGVAKIELRKIYPSEGGIICDKTNYPDCDRLVILDNKVNSQPYVSTFVSLCRKEKTVNMIYDKCELALLMVSSEEKRTE